jgi:CRISPR type I-E-associated protein CasB/Cse2
VTEHEFFAALEARAASDSALRPSLRDSLAFPVGKHVDSFRYVEPLVIGLKGWRRDAHFLAAGLWALHDGHRNGKGPRISLGAAAAKQAAKTKSPGIERRLLALVDTDVEGMPSLLSHMVTLLKDWPLDFPALLKGIQYWKDDDRNTQFGWLRDFYHHAKKETKGGKQ